MITIQKYVRAQSLEEAYTLNQKKSCRIIGGMQWIKMSRGSVGTAVDLSDLGLDKIEETDTEFSIGAMVTLREIEQHPALNKALNGAPAAAVKDIVGVQFRNLATVGGSLWGRFGFSDVLAMFLAVDSYVELYKGGIISLEEFASMKYDNDILVRLIVKKDSTAPVYRTMRNQRTDFPVLTCACGKKDGQYVAVIGARPGRACVFRDEQQILAGGITKESAGQFAQYVASNVKTAKNVRGSAEYRKHLAKVLVERNILEMGGLL